MLRPTSADRDVRGTFAADLSTTLPETLARSTFGFPVNNAGVAGHVMIADRQ